MHTAFDEQATRLSDEALLRLVRDQRDPDAFGELYNRYASSAMSCAMAVLFDRSLAADAVQSAFLDLWRASGTYRSERGTVAAWIVGITANRCIDLMRRGRTQERTRAALRSQPAPARERDSTLDEASWHAQAGTLRTRVDGLPDEQRQVVDLCFFAGLSHREVARRLQVPLGTVKSRVRLALQHLRADLSAYTPR